jgi:TRAP transporter TAXI family solute receptor
LAKTRYHHFTLWLVVVLLAAFVATDLSPVFAAAKAKKDYGGIKFITIASGTGDWGLIGGKLADIINREIPGITATSIPGGATVNISRIERGEAQIGLVHSFLPYLAVKGENPYDQPHNKLRMMISLWKGYAHVVVPKNSKIQDISDLAKAPYDVWNSKPGLGSQILNNAIFKAYGFTPEDIRKIGGVVHEIGLNDGADMMKDRRMDFLIFPVVYPYSMLIDIDTTVGMKLLPIDGEPRERLLKLLPGLVADSIPKGAYRDLKQDMPTVANFHQLACSSDLPDELVYDIMEAIVGNLPNLRGLSDSLKAISIDNALLGMEAEIHPGAAKFYKDKGMM